jgi:hypothetical protein
VPDDASNWKMLIVQDGSAHSARALSSTPTATGRAHLAHPRHGSPALSCLLAIVSRNAARPAARVLVGSRAITAAKVKATSSLAPRSTRFNHCSLSGASRSPPAVPCAEYQGRFRSKEQAQDEHASKRFSCSYDML